MGKHGKLDRPFLARTMAAHALGNNAVDYVKPRKSTWPIAHSFINHHNMGDPDDETMSPAT